MRLRSQSKHDCVEALQATAMRAMQSSRGHSPRPHFHDSGNDTLVPDSLSRYPPSAIRPPLGSCVSDRPSTRRLRALLGGWFEVRGFRETFEKWTPKNLLYARERRVSSQNVVNLGARTRVPIYSARSSQLTVSQLGGNGRDNFWVRAEGARHQKPLVVCFQISVVQHPKYLSQQL